MVLDVILIWLVWHIFAPLLVLVGIAAVLWGACLWGHISEKRKPKKGGGAASE